MPSFSFCWFLPKNFCSTGFLRLHNRCDQPCRDWHLRKSVAEYKKKLGISKRTKQHPALSMMSGNQTVRPTTQTTSRAGDSAILNFFPFAQVLWWVSMTVDSNPFSSDQNFFFESVSSPAWLLLLLSRLTLSLDFLVNSASVAGPN